MESPTVAVRFPTETRWVSAHYEDEDEFLIQPIAARSRAWFRRLVPDEIIGWTFVQTIGSEWIAYETVIDRDEWLRHG